MVALSILGSAILLSSCDKRGEAKKNSRDEGLMTEYSEMLSITESQNGQVSYTFSTPLLEGFTQARDPYREFRKGIELVTYQKDSVGKVDMTLVADYAINYDKRQLWEAKGNVVVRKFDGTTFYFQQLFWNSLTKKVYSNVDGKVVKQGGRDVMVFEGFESDEKFENWRFRSGRLHTEVEFTPRQRQDSLAQQSPQEKEMIRQERKKDDEERREAQNKGPKKRTLKLNQTPSKSFDLQMNDVESMTTKLED